MELLQMFAVFFKVGLFTIGGGLVAIPIMQDFVIHYGWVSEKAFVDMIAVSQSTPGPIGINLATYVGQTQYGLLGSIVVTIGMVLPSFIIISIIARFMKTYLDNSWVKAALSKVRPTVVGVILAAGYLIAKVSLLQIDDFSASGQITDLVDMKKLVVFGVFFISMFKFKWHPILYIVLGGVTGILFL